MLSSGTPTGRSSVGRVTATRAAADHSAAAAGWVAPLLTGPPQPCRVLAVHRTVALVATDHPSRPSRVLALLSADEGTATAHAVRTAGPLPADGATGVVGGGQLLMGGVRHVLRRTWDSRVQPAAVDPEAMALLRTLLTGRPVGLPGALLDRAHRLLVTGDRSEITALATALVGCGAGSTPAGDDLLAGAALAARLTGDHDLLAALVAGSSGRDTTALSADLLRAALAGHTAVPVLRLLAALRPGRRQDDRIIATATVLGLGHTSGADLLSGLLAGLARSGHGSAPRDDVRRLVPTTTGGRA